MKPRNIFIIIIMYQLVIWCVEMLQLSLKILISKVCFNTISWLWTQRIQTIWYSVFIIFIYTFTKTYQYNKKLAQHRLYVTSV